MANGGQTLSAILRDSPKKKEKKVLEIDEEKARLIHNDLEKLWNEIVNSDDTKKLYGKYMSIIERFKEDILNDR
jgi:hypothetical protein